MPRRPLHLARRIGQVMIFLLLGAITSIAVSWGLALAVNPVDPASGANHFSDGHGQIGWDRHIGTEMVGIHQLSSNRPMPTAEECANLNVPNWAIVERAKSHDVFWAAHAFGWPRISMYYRLTPTRRAVGNWSGLLDHVHGLATSMTWKSKFTRVGTVPRVLPLAIIPVGFAFDSLLYAVLICFLVCGL